MKPIFIAYEPGWKETRQTGREALRDLGIRGAHHLTILIFPSNPRKLSLHLGHHILNEVDKAYDRAVTGVKP